MLRLALALLLAFAALPAAAASLIRDVEIEATLQRIAYPIFRAAALNPALVQIYIVDDPEPNAFVAGGQNIFLNTGMLTRLKTIDQLRAVIAHETGHIAGGHLVRRDAALGGLRGAAVIGALGAAAAAAAGTPEAGVAIMMGSAQVAQRSALAHSRSEEASADQAGLRYLAAAGGNPEAILEVLRQFRGQEALSPRYMDPYAQSHPLWSERIALIEDRIAKMPPVGEPDPEDAYWHRRMIAKLEAFLQTPNRTLAHNPDSDASEIATLSRAVAYHRRPDLKKAETNINALLAIRPDDPYYLDLQGQILLENGRASAAAEAYRRAAELDPNEPLILGGLGRALLNIDDRSHTQEARDVLARSAQFDKANAGVLRDLALAEARLGHDGAAALATAERYLLTGDQPDAFRNAVRASDLLPMGSPGWRRAQDLVSMTRRKPR